MSEADTPTAPLRVSYSTAAATRECEQKYVYRYIERLRPIVEDATPLHLGSVLHTYLEHYYRGVMESSQDRRRTSAASVAAGLTEAHEQALLAASDEHSKELAQLSKLAANLDQMELAQSLLEIIPRALILARAYHRVHADDVRRHEVLLVEEKFVFPVKDGVVLPGRIDLVTRDRQTGQVILWEHKTAKRIPRQETRLSDLQTFLYNIVLEDLKGMRADAVLWDYIQTIPPKPPAILKDGTISKSTHQVTTVELYVQALKDNAEALAEKNLGPADYVEAVEAVRARERETMFVRYEMPVLGREDILLRDYIRTVNHIERLNADPSSAVRNIGFTCNFCPFAQLCRTVLTGGNEESDRNQYYKVEPPHPEETVSEMEGDLFDGIT